MVSNRLETLVFLSDESLKESSEGCEDSSFWATLGGNKERVPDTGSTDDESAPAPRLFQLSNSSGAVTVEEIPEPFAQEDLCSDDIMLLFRSNRSGTTVGFTKIAGSALVLSTVTAKRAVKVAEHEYRT